jgi:release factor glutamine methyltransferase
MARVTLSALHREARERLAKAGVEDASLEARILVEGLTDTTRTDALISPDRPVSAEQVEAVHSALVRRLAHEPVHRILGWREFYGLRLELSPETLEPRPDTEALVDLVLPFAEERMKTTGACRILDLGTGTGAIALALIASVPGATATGVDISPEALVTAARNADINGLGKRFAPLCSDWFERVEGEFDLIVSNPPYIATTVWEGLDKEVREFDPRRALDAGDDGLDAYRAIAADAGPHIAAEGMIAVEVGYDQSEAVTGIFAANGLSLVETRRDLGGHERALAFKA